MRFGIMDMQLGALIPPQLSPADLPAHIANFDHAALARDLHGRGFDPIELGGDLVLFMPHTFAPPAVERLAALKAETGLTYTVHLPLWSSEPSTLLEPVRRGSVQATVDCIRATLPLEPEVYVLRDRRWLRSSTGCVCLSWRGRSFCASSRRGPGQPCRCPGRDGPAVPQTGDRDHRVPVRADSGTGRGADLPSVSIQATSCPVSLARWTCSTCWTCCCRGWPRFICTDSPAGCPAPISSTAKTTRRWGWVTSTWAAC